MKAKKIIKWGCGIATLIFAALLLLIGSFIYVTRYRITDIDAATSLDGTYEIVFQAVGEPDWPFGYSHARIVLKRNGETVTKQKFDVANDGGVLHPENWSVRWEENCVKVIISGEEQPDALYTYFFDGAVRHETLAVQELENREPVSSEMMFDEPTKDFSDLVTENEKGESIFSIPIENFIDCYMDAFCDHLKQFDICYVHPLFEHRWGQRIVRFYDPDKHIIEVGEKLDAVILRFMEQGLSAEETAARMDIPLDFVTACLNKE